MKIANYTLRKGDLRQAELVREMVTDYTATKKIDNDEKVVKMMCAVFDCDTRCEEGVFAVAYDTGMNVLGVFELSCGASGFCYVEPSALFTRLLLLGAKSFILVHNHPGETLKPSVDDERLTIRIREGGDLLGCKMLDHIHYIIKNM